jgi:riboflavin transporter FmnP
MYETSGQGTKLNTKNLALIIVFVALAAAIDGFVPKIPFPLAPFLIFNLWEIPILVCFIVFGPKTGLVVALLNSLVLLILAPGYLPTGPFYNLIALLSMLIGVFAAYKIATYKCPSEKIGPFLKKHQIGLSISMTTLGIVSRIAVTTVANYFLITQPSPIGFGSFFEFGGLAGHAGVIAFLPFSAIFNAIQALYTIPVAIIVSIAVLSALKKN